MKFNTQTEVEAFGFSINATHYVKRDGWYSFFIDLGEDKIPPYHGSKLRVDLVYVDYLKEWKPWENAEYMGKVDMCRDMVGLEMKVVK